MDRPQRAPQLYAYGYIVCLIAVVTMLFSLNSLVRNAFDFANPNMSGEVTREFGSSSLEACRQRYLSRRDDQPQSGETGARAVQLPSDSALTAACREEKATRVEFVRYQAMKSMVTSGLMLLPAIVLFATHWLWLRRIRAEMA